MDYTSIHIYGHLLSDDILRSIEQDNTLVGNREQDYCIDSTTSSAIDYVWSSLRNDWRFYQERSYVKDPYGTRKSRDLMERLFMSLGYELTRQSANVEAAGKFFDITYLCPQLGNMPFIVIGDRINDCESIATLDKCSLDYRAKGQQRKKSSHATMLEYLNSTENVYGIISNGQTLRLIRNSGQLVKLTYIEFDLRRMLEEDKYTEFCLMFRLLHASRFRTYGDEPCVLERWFNLSIESGNRIREGLSQAVQKAMEMIGNAAVKTKGEGNEALRSALADGTFDAAKLNKELIHFIYRILFLFIIEDRNLVYQIPDSPDDPDYKKVCNYQEIHKQYYAASRLRRLSELNYLKVQQYSDIWKGLIDTFRLFEDGVFGERLGIKPLGGVLFNSDTLHYLKECEISNKDILQAFSALNEFIDDRGQRVKINYSALDVEEFGSVYEGILEMRPFIQPGHDATDWQFGFVGGLDRQSTSSYYTRPDLVQSIIRTTLEPVIKERIEKLQTPEEKVKSLLSMKVCDAASGSGHIVLAMARTIAWYVCTIRTGEDNPASLDYREALREVIQKCVYAVDYNPDAVELCKVVLWIEGYCAGKPLSFLDAHIRCGNSVVGITDLDTLINGVPKEAFSAESKEALKAIRDLNKRALDDIDIVKKGKGAGLQITLFDSSFMMTNIESEQVGLADKVREISAMPENTLSESSQKQMCWEELMISPRVECLRRACDIYTYAFYKQFTMSDMLTDDLDNIMGTNPIPYTRTVYQALEEIKQKESTKANFQALTDEFKTEVSYIARQQRFFHWCVEFPEVFAYDGGFDVMCGNPPWDKIKVEDKKWFESHGRADIVNAGTAAQRKRAIAELPITDPALYDEYCQAQRDAESMSRFVRFSGRFELTATGDIDLYPMFAELCLSFSREAWGLVMPTGIALNDPNKAFFAKLTDENRLISLYDFENREALFDIHRMFKFCLLTAGKQQDMPRDVKGGFYLTRIDHLLDPNRIYTLRTSDFALLNPNTKTCSVFRTAKDASLAAKVYRKCPILIDEVTGSNPWHARISNMMHMSHDSGDFKTYEDLSAEGASLSGNIFTTPQGKVYIPVYEGKMIWFYNHHYASWPTGGERPNAIPNVEVKELSDPSSSILAWYWSPEEDVMSKLEKLDNDGNVVWKWEHSWLLGYRKISNATNERTFVSSIIPLPNGAGDSIIYVMIDNVVHSALVQGMFSSLTFDYISKQKMGGSNMSNFITKQLPVLSLEQIPQDMIIEIVSRVAKLCYFNHDLDGWAEELWEELTPEQRAELPQLGDKEPFVYDPEKRAVWQAELDAIFTHLYGLSTEDLRYILDPEDVCGEGCINETFRVLKDNEIRQYGEYRTKRLVMDAWYKFGYNR